MSEIVTPIVIIEIADAAALEAFFAALWREAGGIVADEADPLADWEPADEVEALFGQPLPEPNYDNADAFRCRPTFSASAHRGPDDEGGPGC